LVTLRRFAGKHQNGIFIMELPFSLTFLIKYFFDKIINVFKPVDFKTPNAPKDIFEYIIPGVSPAFIKDRLKSPNFENESSHVYKFSNLYLELIFADSKVETINAILPDLAFKKFKVHPFDFYFGKIRMKDVYENPTHIIKDGSSKFGAIWIEEYYGNPGHYNYYCFGVYVGPGVRYNDKNFEAYFDQTELTDKQKKLKVNFLSISAHERKGSPIYFEYLR
jgi:hypothetical protein